MKLLVYQHDKLLLENESLINNSLGKHQKFYWVGSACYDLKLWVHNITTNTLTVYLGDRNVIEENRYGSISERAQRGKEKGWW